MVADAPLSASLGPRCPLLTVDEPDLGRTADVILRIGVVQKVEATEMFTVPYSLGFSLSAAPRDGIALGRD